MEKRVILFMYISIFLLFIVSFLNARQRTDVEGGRSGRSLRPRRDVALPTVPQRQSQRGAAPGARPPCAGAADVALPPAQPGPGG